MQALYSDILIHVTRFFRDRETFDALRRAGAARICRRHSPTISRSASGYPGCSTGEEAYSVAIVTSSIWPSARRTVPIQIFATDISEPAIEHARAGVYRESIAADVTPERLRRFFTKIDGGYRVNKAVRDACIFARQDLTRDPPFSKLDLIVCRNVLIYLGSELQKKVMRVFHYALKPTGASCSATPRRSAPAPTCSTTADRKHRIYSKKAGRPRRRHRVSARAHAARIPAQAAARPDARPWRRAHGRHEATRLIQDRYAPPGVVVDGQLNVVQFRGQTGTFLEPAPGEPSLNMLKMAREGLLHGLRDGVAAGAQDAATLSANAACACAPTAAGATSTSRSSR